MSSHKSKEQKSNCKIPILLNTFIQVQKKFELSNSKTNKKQREDWAHVHFRPPLNTYAANWITIIKQQSINRYIQQLMSLSNEKKGQGLRFVHLSLLEGSAFILC